MNPRSEQGLRATASRRAMIVSMAVCLALSCLTGHNARAEDSRSELSCSGTLTPPVAVSPLATALQTNLNLP